MNTREKKVRPAFRTYPLDVYRQYFTDERWEEIQKIINNWENPELKNGKTLKGVISNPETGVCFIGEDFEKSANHQKEYYQKHVFEKILKDEEYDKCAEYTWQIDHDKIEKKKFDKAKKISGYVYDSPVFFNDEMYDCVDDLKDIWECYHDPEEYPLPDYVYGSIEENTLNPKDLEQMIDVHFERLNSDFDDFEMDIPNIPDYLQEAWKRFCEEKGEKYLIEDTKTVVLIDKN
jgi:hypothetical protein